MQEASRIADGGAMATTIHTYIHSLIATVADS